MQEKEESIVLEISVQKLSSKTSITGKACLCKTLHEFGRIWYNYDEAALYQCRFGHLARK